jgi:hypothetical protein
MYVVQILNFKCNNFDPENICNCFCMERIIFIFKSMHLFQHAGLIKKKYTIFTVGAI